MTGKSNDPNMKVDGDPEIACPNKRLAAFARDLFLEAPRDARDELNVLFNELLPYERQLALVDAWFFGMQKLASEDHPFHQQDERCCVRCGTIVCNGNLGRLRRQKRVDRLAVVSALLLSLKGC
jgi:hypothetical protein